MNKKIVALIVSLLILCSCTAVFAISDSNETEILSPTYDLGDVDMNLKVNVKDATAVQKHLADMVIFNDAQLSLADANLDGSINIKDATYIQKVVAGLAQQLKPEATDPATDAPTAAYPTDEDITVPEYSQGTEPTEEPATSEDTRATDPTEDSTEETTPAVQPTDPEEIPTQEPTETTTEEPTEATQPATKDPDKPIELPFIPFA